MRFFIRYSIFFILIGTLSVSSCSISKTEKETSFTQNVTAKYNIIYNSNLMLAQEQKALLSNSKPNYQIQFPVFVDPRDDYQENKLMDSVVQKAYKIINNKAKSKFVNEAYLIIGKANYLKGGFYTANEYFEYLTKNSKDYPEFVPQAYAWKARSLMQMGRVSKANLALDSAFMFADKSKSSNSLIHALRADFLIRQEKDAEAIPFLVKAIDFSDRNDEKSRWKFLLAQLYQKNGERQLATKLFQKIADSNVPFEMAFESELQATFLKTEGGLSVENKTRPLFAMLSDGKNEDFKDQIYFQIGQVYLEGGKDKEALKYFNQSLNQKNNSSYQTTETYLTMANYYFDNKKYLKAKLYFDSAGAILPSDYNDVANLQRKIGYLNHLINLYEDVTTNDTLLLLHSYSPNVREQQIEEYVQETLKEQLEKTSLIEKNDKASKKRNSIQKGNSNVRSSNNQFVKIAKETYSDSKFYFNNQEALLLGASAFKIRWGNRSLVDNWRNVNSSNTIERSENILTENDSQSPKISAAFDHQYFLKNEKNRYIKSIPQNDDEANKLKQIVHDDLIKIGNLYRDYMKDDDLAIKAFEDYVKRFPNTSQGAEVYYSLYRLYESRDLELSNKYKSQLLTYYPNSIFAQVVLDPLYLQKMRKEKDVLSVAYARVFETYVQGYHDRVIKDVDLQLQKVTNESEISAQLYYLKTLAIGRVGSVEEFVSSLNQLVTNYPNDSLVTPLAKEHLNFIETHPNMFVNRVNALQDVNKDRITFVDEPNMTEWPSLTIEGDYRTGQVLPVKDIIKKDMPPKRDVVKVKPIVRKDSVADHVVEVKKEGEKTKVEERVIVEGLATADATKKISITGQLNEQTTIVAKNLEIGKVNIDFGPNDFRDKKILPDTAHYYFVINVADNNVNLSPSRYGLGQFIRTRYAKANINHQLKNVNNENQLIFIGPFQTYEDVKSYQLRILAILPDIMKVPQNIYNTFVITQELFGTLSDAVEINNYYQVYNDQIEKE